MGTGRLICVLRVGTAERASAPATAAMVEGNIWPAFEADPCMYVMDGVTWDVVGVVGC
jgi:hypothetical protein